MKNMYPDLYTKSWKKLNEIELRPKVHFHNSFKNCDISNDDY